MKIIYYEIDNCEYELIGGKSAITAPEGTDEELLKKRGFTMLLDGRWVHYLTESEAARVKVSTDSDTLVFGESEDILPEEQPDYNKAAAYSLLALSGMGVLFGILFIALGDSVLVGIICFCISIILLFLTRLMFPENKAPKVTSNVISKITIAFLIISVFAFFIIISACNSGCDQCMDDVKSLHDMS